MNDEKHPNTVIDRQAVVDALTASGSPLTDQELAERLGIQEQGRSVLAMALAELERDGRIVRNRAGLLLVTVRADLLSGQVQGHREGHGLLVRDDGGPDLVLDDHEMSKVLHADRVLARMTGSDRRGRPLGEIVEVIERRTNRLVGRLLNERGVSIVVPEDQRIQHDILVPPQAAAKAQPGQVVVVEIIQQPQRYVQPIGRVVEVLGQIEDPGMEIEIAVRKFAVPYQFSEAAQQEAQALPSEVGPRDRKGRIDLRDIPLVTIDGEDARDFDDAVYCEPIARKGWRLIVAIADVSHYVQPGGALDREAQARSTSVYFPRRVIPMLPERLSNGLCSLNASVERVAMVCDIVIGPKGAIKGYQFYPALIRSHARLTYTEVWEALAAPDSPAQHRHAALLPHLRNLHRLYEVLSSCRVQRGALDLDTVETQIVCNAAGRIERIVPRVRNDAHRLIEECMLAANVCAADFLQRGRQPALYRVHEGPTPQKLEALRASLRAFGLQLDGAAAPEPTHYAKLLRNIRSRPDTQLLQTMVLRSMQQAIYTPHNSGHFGLAYEAYAHFTSPIRRYPDLLVHRAIKALLAAGRFEPVFYAEDGSAADLGAAMACWEKLGALCSANERRADEASRDVEAWLKSYYVRERTGETFSGSISAVVPFGVFVILDDLYVEGLVHVSELGSEYFHFNEALHELRGERTGLRFRLADRLTVQVARVDLEARRIDFRPVRQAGSVSPPARPDGRDASQRGRHRQLGDRAAARSSRQARRAERLAAQAAEPAAPTGQRGKVGVGGRKRRRGRAAG
ncbi:MAG TPA: ribonuclease R [Burkholderiaceae bacterium]|nr:ribonuclease R [Burkholderiaceae bacterium]